MTIKQRESVAVRTKNEANVPREAKIRKREKGL